MSCPGSSYENCKSCKHNGYCDIKWSCNGRCDGCEDLDCENNSDGPNYRTYCENGHELSGSDLSESRSLGHCKFCHNASDSKDCECPACGAKWSSDETGSSQLCPECGINILGYDHDDHWDD